MTNRNALNTLRQILGVASKLDARLPKAFTADATALIDLTNKVNAYSRNAAHISVPDAILDSLAADDNPYDDPVVHEALRHADVAQHAGRVDAALADRINSFLGLTAVDVLKALKPIVHQAGETLGTAVHRFGDLALDDTRAILSRGGDAASLWAEAQTAEINLRHVLNIRTFLSSVPGSGIRNAGQYRALVIAEIPAAEFTRTMLGRPMPTGWTVAQRGWTFDLATPDELEARIAGVVSHIDQGSGVDGYREGFQRQHGTGVPV